MTRENPNPVIHAPYGDAFIVGTPHIDLLSNRLYAEQRQRELQQQKDNAALDEEFTRNMSNMRDADIPDLAKKYGDFKAANMALINKHNVTPLQRMEVMQKKADMYKTINESKGQKLIEEETGKGIMSKPDSYEDNAHQFLMQTRRIPLTAMPDEVRNHDYSYKGTDTDFGKIFKDAQGTPKQVYQNESPVDASGAQTKITPYMYGSTPAQYHDMIIGALAKHGAGRDAAAMVSSMTPDVIMGTQQQYQSIAKDKWQKMGVTDPQDLTIQPNDSKAEIFAKHAAQLYAINNDPKEGMPVFRDNKAVERKQKLQDEITMEGIRYKHHISSLYVTAGLKKAGQDDDVAGGDAVLHNIFNNMNATSAGTVMPSWMKPGNAAFNNGNVIPITDPNITKNFAAIRKIGTTATPPDQITYDKSKKQFNIIYDPIDVPKDEIKNTPAYTIPGKTVPLSESDYLNMKVKEMNPNKDIGTLNNKLNKIISKNGGLYNTVQKIYGESAKPETEKPKAKKDPLGIL